MEGEITMTVCDNYWAICNHCICGGFSFKEGRAISTLKISLFVYLINI